MNKFIANIKNNIDFCLRNTIKFSRKNYFLENESKENLFDTVEEIELEDFLFKKYELSYLKNNSACNNYVENLSILNTLDKYLEMDFKENLTVLDIGSKNWSYAKGEYFFFKKYCNNLCLYGIELDSNRLYTNFYSRKEVAEFHIKNLQNTTYIEGNLLEHKKKYDVIIWILPFLTEFPLLKWGLPLKYFKPVSMLNYAYNLLNENGKIFIINQGEEEFDKQIELCNKLHFKHNPIGLIENPFYYYTKDRYLTIIKKQF